MTLAHGGESPGEPDSPEAITKALALVGALGTTALAQELPINSLPIPSGIVTTAAGLASLRAAQALEANPLFNAGLGSKLQGDGVVRVSASFMESTLRRLSSVTNVRDIMHPSHLAHWLQARRYSMLDGMGAAELAKELGMATQDLTTPRTVQLWESQQPHNTSGSRGTIGCVTIDSEGNLAVVTSTGGTGNETPGRIGDTPTVAGTYCSPVVGVSCTGRGEDIVSLAFAARVAVRVEGGWPLVEAMAHGVAEANERGYLVDAIAISREADEVTWVAGGTEDAFAWAINEPDRTVCYSPSCNAD
jgi:L-asparaginase